MGSYTWHEQRIDVQAAVNEFFGRKIEITPRAMAAFQSGATVDDPLDEEEQLSVYEYCIMETLVQASPACWSVLARAGVNVNKLRLVGQRPEPGPLGSATLEWIFRGVEAEALTATARRVKRTRTLYDLDLLTSNLEASLQGEEFTAFGGSVSDALGLDEPPNSRWYNKEAWANVDSKMKELVRSVKAIQTADPSHSHLQFILYEDDSKRLRLQAFGATNLGLLKEFEDMTEKSRFMFRDGLVQPVNSAVPGLQPNTIDRFEDLLNSQHASERDFQLLFEECPFLVTGLDFKRAHPQPILYKDDGSKLIPDFFLEKMVGGWDAIVDLKRPYDEMVVRRRNRTYFQQSLQNAIAQSAILSGMV